MNLTDTWNKSHAGPSTVDGIEAYAINIKIFSIDSGFDGHLAEDQDQARKSIVFELRRSTTAKRSTIKCYDVDTKTIRIELNSNFYWTLEIEID